MKNDNIQEIKIDKLGRLCITPEKEKFAAVFMAEMEISWDSKSLFLYSPKPREWSYLDWYIQILNAAKKCNCQLLLINKTSWVDIPIALKEQMSQYVHP